MIGENIKKLRENLKMSQQEFGLAIGSSQTAVSQYELGQKTPSLKVINKILALAKSRKLKFKPLED
jgi:transcriptional regulator with XRE-family HTH domain